MKFINQTEGYIEPDGVGGYDYVYQFKDHLGNIRLSYKDADDNGVIHGASTQIFFDDFETASGWDGSGASWGQSITAFDDTLTFDGAYSGRIYAAMGTSVAVHSNEWVTIDNDSDTDYIYTAWAYSESPIIRLGLGMKEDGEAGYLTLFDDILVTDELNQWVYVEKRVTVPAHITSLNVRIECAAWENRVGNVWFDHVSIRRVNDPVDVEIVEEKNYYPFGLVHRGYNNVVNGTENKFFTYNGVELEEFLDLNMYEMDMRQYEPAIARWISIDPITHYSASTYNAFDNNPIFFADPSGADSIYNFETGQYVINGTVISFDEAMAYAQNEGNADGSNDNTPNESESGEECCGGYIGSYRHKMGTKERNYYRNHKDQKKIVSKAAYEAGVLATRVSGDLGGDNLGYSGAIRHSYWMYLIAVELGPELAEKLGILHEDYVITIGEHKGKNNLTTRDSKMDVANNAWGINLARETPNLNSLEFEELFLKDVKSQNTTIIIFDKKTIPNQSVKSSIESRKAVREKWKNHESQRVTGPKF